MRASRLLLAVLVTAVVVAGIRWGTFAVGGSDSSCYVIQATRWANLRLQEPQPLAVEAPWPEAPSTFAVTGHVASPTVPGAMVPICASGLSMVMALFFRIGGEPALFAVVPLLGGLLIAAVYALGARLSPRIGLAAAALTAASPVFLYQLVQPMSDVPAAAFWCLAAALASSSLPRSALMAGAATSLAIVVRPNLLPIGVALGLMLLLRPGAAVRARLVAAAHYAAGSLPGCLAVAFINQYFYGSPLSSGYGPAEALFAISNVGPNLRQYLTWMWDTETPFCVLALLAPVVCRRWEVWLGVALFLANLASYLPYVVFPEWSYLRFLLPTLPLVLLLAVATLDWLLGHVVGAVSGLHRRWHVPAPTAALTLATVALMVAMIRGGAERSVFRLAELESRFVRAGTAVAERLPANAVVVTAWESGSVTHYSGRQTLAWDQLDADWLEGALDFFRRRGFEPFLLFERWEEAGFRARFAATDLGRLDWPPAFEIGGQVRIYRPGDRARYVAGQSIRTDYVR